MYKTAPSNVMPDTRPQDSGPNNYWAPSQSLAALDDDLQVVLEDAAKPASKLTDRHPTPHASDCLHIVADKSGTPSIESKELAITMRALPPVFIEHHDPELPTLTRRGTIEEKRKVDEQRRMIFDELKGMSPSPEKQCLYRAIEDCRSRNAELELHLLGNFIPQHSSIQFIAPRAFFLSPLFCARSVSCVRQEHVSIEIPTTTGRPGIQYIGPELRQSDGLVFLSLLQMLRDVQVGTTVSFSPEGLSWALFDRYDGHTRRQLREALERLNNGCVTYEQRAVRLCAHLDSPKFGPWTVALDKSIPDVFRISQKVWLPIERRRGFTDGLVTWLYCYIESQTKLIPMSLTMLMALCGSNASRKAFANTMRTALKQLSKSGIIDSGWSLKDGKVRWMKTPRD
ncbi:MAG: hypothetical protein KIT63_02645 [Rhodoferax sp.]|nr:hypothetical protein [Rhodoferax sp.]